jgi:hypothetical protein
MEWFIWDILVKQGVFFNKGGFGFLWAEKVDASSSPEDLL